MMNISEYLKTYNSLISSLEVETHVESLSEKLEKLREAGGRILIFGNGASASIASHSALDFTKQGKLEAVCFHDASLITAYSNDYGYENAFRQMLLSYSRSGDYVFLISTSGESENMVQVAHQAKKMGLYTVSFTGRYETNRLKSISDESFWVDSHAYNIVENIHAIWICTLIDCLVGRAVYEVK